VRAEQQTPASNPYATSKCANSNLQFSILNRPTPQPHRPPRKGGPQADSRECHNSYPSDPSHNSHRPQAPAPKPNRLDVRPLTPQPPHFRNVQPRRAPFVATRIGPLCRLLQALPQPLTRPQRPATKTSVHDPRSASSARPLPGFRRSAHNRCFAIFAIFALHFAIHAPPPPRRQEKPATGHFPNPASPTPSAASGRHHPPPSSTPTACRQISPG